ncbi:MAG: hypothetical protein AABW58_00535 [Nanoarchaeota archaeon]
MKKFLNKRGSAFNFAFQTMWLVPKIFFLIIFLLVTTTPIGCQSINKQNQLDVIYEREAALIMSEIKTCLQNEISEQFLARCLNRENIGVKVISEGIAFILNPDNYEEEFCKISKKHVCPPEETTLINDENKLRKVKISLVMLNE